MQQTIYNPITSANAAGTVPALPACNMRSRKARLLRHLTQKWDLYGVLTLLASCTTYGLYAIAHVL